MNEHQIKSLKNNLHLTWKQLSKKTGVSIYLLRQYMNANGIKKQSRKTAKITKKKAPKKEPQTTPFRMKTFKKVLIPELRCEIYIDANADTQTEIENYKNAIRRGSHKSVSKSILSE